MWGQGGRGQGAGCRGAGRRVVGMVLGRTGGRPLRQPWSGFGSWEGLEKVEGEVWDARSPSRAFGACFTFAGWNDEAWPEAMMNDDAMAYAIIGLERTKWQVRIIRAIWESGFAIGLRPGRCSSLANLSRMAGQNEELHRKTSRPQDLNYERLKGFPRVRC
jgi:hypothetical protein